MKKTKKTIRKKEQHRVLDVLILFAILISFAIVYNFSPKPYGLANAEFPSLPPHQFYGHVNCYDTNKIVPSYLSVLAVTTHRTETVNYTLNSTANIINTGYGYPPELFFTEGIDNGDNITFFVNNENVYSTLFSSSEIYEVNITLYQSCVNQYICGNSLCESNESCSTCEIDCGSCGGGPPTGGGGNPPGNETIVNETIYYTIQPGTSINISSTGVAAGVSDMLLYTLSQAQIDNFVDKSDSISSQIDVWANIYSDGHKSNLTIYVKNTVGTQLMNFIVYERVPKSFSQNSGLITTIAHDASYRTIKSDPEYVFLYETIDEGQVYRIQHQKNSASNASVLAALSFELYAEDINVVQCTEGEARCSENIVQRCITGMWTDGELCEYRCVEFSNARCVEASELICTEGAMRCDGNDVQLCENNAWTTTETCTTGCVNSVCTELQENNYMTVVAALLAMIIIVVVIFAYKKMKERSEVQEIIERIRSQNRET